MLEEVNGGSLRTFNSSLWWDYTTCAADMQVVFGYLQITLVSQIHELPNVCHVFGIATTTKSTVIPNGA